MKYLANKAINLYDWLEERRVQILAIAVTVAFVVPLVAMQGALAEIVLLDTPQITVEREIETTTPTKEQVVEEIKKQSTIFGVDTDLALRIAECESGYYYKAKNPDSTARGVYQYLIATWEATESAKQGKERNDYKANIREAMIDLANGEHSKWNASKSCWIN